MGLLGEEVRWDDRSFLLAGEKETVAEILGLEIGDEEDGGAVGGVDESLILGLGAKKREITCCFCLPMLLLGRFLGRRFGCHRQPDLLYTTLEWYTDLARFAVVFSEQVQLRYYLAISTLLN